MNNDKAGLFSINQTFNQGDVCYYEGTTGAATGNHIHIEFAVGTFVSLDRITSSSTKLHLVTDLTNISGINNNSCNLYLPLLLGLWYVMQPYPPFGLISSFCS